MNNTQNDIDIKLETAFHYKEHIGKLLPLSFVATEIENYLEDTGDSLGYICRNSSPLLEEKCENGIEIAKAKSIYGKEFVVFYKGKHNKFGLFIQKQTGADTFEYYYIHSWTCMIEDCDWFDCGIPVAEEE